MDEPEVREVIINARIVTPDNGKIDERTRRRIQESDISEKEVLYPYFNVEFKKYDPFPTEACVEELQVSIEESVVSDDQLVKLAEEYDTEDIVRADPVGDKETESFEVGKAFVDSDGESSMIAIDLSIFHEVLG